MIAAALDEEVEAYLGRHRGERDERGHALVVRNGRARGRKVTVGSGTIELRAPRVHDRREGERFTSKILPPYMRRSPKVTEVLPVLYLRGLSTGDFRPALKVLLGEDAAGLSAANITRLVGVWEAEYEAFSERDLSVAVESGYRESTESWAEVLRDVKRRGMKAPVLAIGDGALGFWAAARDVWPETREQRDWVHRLGNVLDKLPKRLQPKAKEALREIMNAPTRGDAKEGIERFEADYGAKHPKAVKSLRRDDEALLAFYDFPAEHWKHIRTTNPIESSFSTVRLRQRVTKGPGSAKRGCLMAFKLLTMAAERWRPLGGAALLPLVRAGVVFRDGQQLEREDEDQQEQGTTERVAA